MNVDDVPMGTELDRTYDEATASHIHKKKREVYQTIMKLLEEYAEEKEKTKTFINPRQTSQINEAMNLIGTKIMKVLENYQKLVKEEIKLQYDSNIGRRE